MVTALADRCQIETHDMGLITFISENDLQIGLFDCRFNFLGRGHSVYTSVAWLKFAISQLRADQAPVNLIGSYEHRCIIINQNRAAATIRTAGNSWVFFRTP
jgi:hypothetical protein